MLSGSVDYYENKRNKQLSMLEPSKRELARAFQHVAFANSSSEEPDRAIKAEPQVPAPLYTEQAFVITFFPAARRRFFDALRAAFPEEF